jgi:hypothetical protein
VRPTSPIGTPGSDPLITGGLVEDVYYPIVGMLAQVWSTAYRAGQRDAKSGWFLRNPYCASGCICGECRE